MWEITRVEVCMVRIMISDAWGHGPDDGSTHDTKKLIMQTTDRVCFRRERILRLSPGRNFWPSTRALRFYSGHIMPMSSPVRGVIAYHVSLVWSTTTTWQVIMPEEASASVFSGSCFGRVIRPSTRTICYYWRSIL